MNFTFQRKSQFPLQTEYDHQVFFYVACKAHISYVWQIQ